MIYLLVGAVFLARGPLRVTNSYRPILWRIQVRISEIVVQKKIKIYLAKTEIEKKKK